MYLTKFWHNSRLCGKAQTQIIKSNQEIIESEVTPPIPQTEISPNLKIELCLLTSMRSGSRPPAYPSMNIVIVNCGMGETCTPSNSEIFGNDFGYVYSYYHYIHCLSYI